VGTTVSIPLIPYNTGAGGGAPLHVSGRGAWGMSCHAQFFPAPSVGEERASAVFDLAYQQELYRLQGGAHEVGGGATGEGGAGGIPSLQKSWGGGWGVPCQQQFCIFVQNTGLHCPRKEEGGCAPMSKIATMRTKMLL